MASPAVSYSRENQKRFLNELKELLRIPSVSTAPEHKPDIRRLLNSSPAICGASEWKTSRSSGPRDIR